MTSKDLRRPRYPIIINGAEPAGPVHSVSLKNVRILLEVCERYRHDLVSRLRCHGVTLIS